MALNWDNITVQQFQQLNEVWKNAADLEPADLMADTVGICFNLTSFEVDSLAWAEFKDLCAKLDFLNTVPEWKPVPGLKVNGRRYRFIYDVRQIHAARNIEVKTFGQSDEDGEGLVPNLHKVAASMVVPRVRTWYYGWKDDKYDARKHEEYAADLRQAPITSIYGSALFFCELFKRSIPLIAGYLTQEPTDDGAAEGDPAPAGFMQVFGWEYNAVLVAEHERITLAEAWDLPYIQFLNDLSYLKALQAHKKSLIK